LPEKEIQAAIERGTALDVDIVVTDLIGAGEQA
jgi:hypothetical protein